MVNIGFSQWNWRFWQEVSLVIQHSYWKFSIFNVSIIELNGPFSIDMLKFEYFYVEMMVNIKHGSSLSTLKQNGWLKSTRTWAQTPPSSLAIYPLLLKFITAGSSSSRWYQTYQRCTTSRCTSWTCWAWKNGSNWSFQGGASAPPVQSYIIRARDIISSINPN